MMLNARKVYGPGDEITPNPPGDRRRQAAREARTRAAVARKRIGMLMQEVTHRVKNSLQSIAAVVEARSHKSGEGKAAPERVSHCINALGQLYSKLVNPTRLRPSMQRPIWDDLCRDLVASVHKEAATSIVLKTGIDSALLPTDQGIRWGSL